jgi:hypothetical protein
VTKKEFMTLTLGVSVIKLWSSALIKGPNKLERLPNAKAGKTFVLHF